MDSTLPENSLSDSGILDRHLSSNAMEKHNMTLRFVDNEITVNLSTGECHPLISLSICEYLPLNHKSLLISDLDTESNDCMQTFATVSTLQYGIRNYNVDGLRPKLWGHIEAISKQEKLMGDEESLSWKLLQAICCFHEAHPPTEPVCLRLPGKF